MPNDDQQRLEALKRFFVLDHTESEDVITRLVRVAAQVYGVAYAVLTLREGEDERVAGTYGFDASALPPDAVFCERATGPSIPLTVADVTEDARFEKNPLVHGPQEARFYAGVPLKSAEGFTLGTLAILDPVSQELNGEGMALLVDLGALVEPALNLQRVQEAQAEAEQARRAAEATLEQTEERRAALEAELETTRTERDTARSDGDALQAAYDALNAERDALTADRDALHAQLETARTERDTLHDERNALQVAHNALCDERDALAAERDALADERDAVRASRDALRVEHETLRAERDDLRDERNALTEERDILATEREALTDERGALTAERNALQAERDTLHDEREALLAEREALTQERDQFASALEAANAERDAAGQEAAERGRGAGDMAAEHEAILEALDRRDRLAAAAGEAAARLAADPTALRDALAVVAPVAGATRAVLVMKKTAGPAVCAAWHAEGSAPLAEPGERLDADELDAWADAREVEHLAALPVPGGLVLLDAPAWSPGDEAGYRAAFTPLAVALRRRESEAEGRDRNRLLSGISHEVRTALTSILGYAEMISDEAGDEAQAMVERILGSSTRLLQTLDTVLDIARLEAGGGPAALTPVDIGAIVEAAAAPFRPHADARDLAFFAAGTDLGAHAWADADALGRALAHLLANAFTFTDQGGVRLRVYAEDDGVGVEVQDTGVGIAPEFLPHLFDAFQREDAERGRDPGSGLGLALTKRLVDLMGGEITVTSLKGQGSMFRILLRSAPAPSDLPAPGGDGFATPVQA